MSKDVAVGRFTEITINKWDVNAVKHALDDATKEVGVCFTRLLSGYEISIWSP